MTQPTCVLQSSEPSRPSRRAWWQVDVNCVPRISGCNFATATNFDSVATIYEEGSCTFAVGGCTDQDALNFLDVATVDDGGAPG